MDVSSDTLRFYIARLVVSCILSYAPILMFRKTYIPRKRVRALNRHVLAESMRTGVPENQMTEVERRQCNLFWLMRCTIPVLVLTLLCLCILWQDILFGLR